jgi:putative ABC transport system permease protein
MNLFKDIQYSLRGMARRPGFTASAVLSLGLGIGATTAIFTLFNAVFFQPVPVREPSRVVIAYSLEMDVGYFGEVSYPNFVDLREQGAQVTDLAAFQRLRLNWAHGDRPERIVGQIVTGNYFGLLGVNSFLGRTLVADDDSPAGQPVAVLSHRFWSSSLGSDPNVVGKDLVLNGQSIRVVGVAPAGFNGTSPFDGPALWVPMTLYKRISPFAEYFDARDMGMFEMVGRLRPGVSVPQAVTALRLAGEHLRQQYPDVNENLGIGVLPLAQAAIGPKQRPVFLRAGTFLLVVVGLLLLIACSNVASLLLARGVVRRREIAIRLSLGVQRRQLVRQLLAESIGLSLLGGAAGLLIGHWMTALLWKFRSPSIAESSIDLSLNSRVLLFAFGVSLLTGVLFGLAPALQAFRTDLASILRDASSSMGRSNRRMTWRNALVVGQVTLSLIVLIGSGLFLRSLSRIQQTDPGFVAERLLHMNFDLASQGYDEARGREFYRQALTRVQSLPGVSKAAMATNQILRGGGWCIHVIPPDGDLKVARETPPICANTVTPDYFETLGIPLLQGRGFTAADRNEKTPVVIVNQTMARRYVQGRSPIGARLRSAGDSKLELEIIGVVADSKYVSMSEGATPSFYRPLEQSYQPGLSLYVRTDRDPKLLLSTVRREVQALDPTLPLANVATAEDLISASFWSARTGAALLSFLGLLSLLLACTGLYGVVGYSVAQRHREIGIRMAMGARQREVIAMVVGETGKIVGIGLLFGWLGAVAGSRLVSGLLYGVHSADAVTYLASALLLALVALLTSFLATRRGTRVDPVQALKS